MTPSDEPHRQIDHGAVQRAAADLLRALGADVDAVALQEPPRRVADDDQLIVAQAIPFHSLCMSDGSRVLAHHSGRRLASARARAQGRRGRDGGGAHVHGP
jgi:hypothetical protein